MVSNGQTHMYICKQCDSMYVSMYKNHLKMVKGCRIDTGSCKRHYQKGFSKNTWNKGKLQTGTGLGGQRARQT